ncbi:putative MKL/myocardin-like protein 2 [Hypsibius exemplaris]|uniref:MKL/myocardin-like protein 2 n=1 Tax=Hypsibius exemplaris TaxID=2072580 RepID=A0A1W0XAW2_HYPEX|nr:putative MKL/myocardin-like protein 2 [Hypsibius exemplaris]
MDHDTISVYVPRGSKLAAATLQQDGAGTSSDSRLQQGSPLQQQGSPQATVDETSLQKQKDKNVISLKVKLAQRRPVNQLIDQGIMPPPKTPSAFFEQRRHLERARTGDILKTKIEKRPDRQTLVQQHILEDTKIAPSLADTERKLKKAKLSDYLSDKIAHRPGPLELVQANILKLPVYDEGSASSGDGSGCLDFPNGEDTPARSVDNDTEYSTEEDGSSSTASSPTGALANLKDLQLTSPASSGGTIPSTPASSDSKAPSPANSISSSCPGSVQQQQQQLLDIARRRANSLIQSDATSAAATSAVSSQGYPGSASSSSVPPTTSTNTSSGNGSSSSSATAAAGQPHTATFHNSHRRSKKSRVKPPVPQKARTLKFHEYRPAAVAQNKAPAKNTATSSSGPDGSSSGGAAVGSVAVSQDGKATTYELTLKQQQQYLQWEMEAQLRRNETAQAESSRREPRSSQEVSHPTPAEHPRPQPAQHLTLTFPAQQTVMTGVQFQPIRLVQQQLIINSTIPPAPAMNIGCYPSQQMNINVPSPPEIPAPPPPAPPPAPAAPPTVEATPPSTAEQQQPKKPAKLDEMRVKDLRDLLLARKLPVSGSKTALLERLRVYFQANPDDNYVFSLPAASAASPQDAKPETSPSPKQEGGVPSTASDASMEHKSFELPAAAPVVAQQQPTLSFLQLDPLQQQQATQIALQTLSQMRSMQQQSQGVQMNLNSSTSSCPSPMEVDKQPQLNGTGASHHHQNRTHSLPTIFLATSQPNGGTASLTFQSTPLQMQQNAVPCIITMNGLNSTLNLLNGFNIVTTNNGNQTQNQIQQQPVHDQTPDQSQQQQQQPHQQPRPQLQSQVSSDSECKTSLEKAIQGLRQKLLFGQTQREQKFANEQPLSVSMDVYQEQPQPQPPQQQPDLQNCASSYRPNSAYADSSNGGLDAMLTDEEPVVLVTQQQSTAGGGVIGQMDNDFASLGKAGGDAGNHFAAHCSYGQPSSLSDCVKSEAMDDIFEILIRSGEIPADAAQEVLPKSQILQHPKPSPPPPIALSANSGLLNGYHTDLHYQQQQQRQRSYSHPSPLYQSDDLMHSSSNSGPLPPIQQFTSISPANHGSPASQSGETSNETSSIQQQFALLEYLAQHHLQAQSQPQQQPQQHMGTVHAFQHQQGLQQTCGPVHDMQQQNMQMVQQPQPQQPMQMDYQCDSSAFSYADHNASDEQFENDEFAAFIQGLIQQGNGTNGVDLLNVQHHPQQQNPSSSAPSLPEILTQDLSELKQEDLMNDVDAFQDVGNSMDQSDSGLGHGSGGTDELDQTFLNFFDEFPSSPVWNIPVDPRNGSYLGGPGGAASVMYWNSESEPMM